MNIILIQQMELTFPELRRVFTCTISFSTKFASNAHVCMFLHFLKQYRKAPRYMIANLFHFCNSMGRKYYYDMLLEEITQKQSKSEQ